MPYKVLVDEIETELGEAILIHYISTLKKLTVTVEYNDRVLTEHPILYNDGRVAYDFPNSISEGTRKACDYLMRLLRYEATRGDWDCLNGNWRDK